MWFQIGLALLSILVLYLLRPKIPSPEAATVDDYNVPKSKEGEEVGIVYGTHWIKDMQITWYGDFDTKAVTKKQSK